MAETISVLSRVPKTFRGLSVSWAVMLLALPISVTGCGFHTFSGPCSGWHTDPKACVDATANAQVIWQVKIGQTTEEVRKIMQKGPQRREATEAMETWSYFTDYDQDLFTTIIFKDDLVTEIKVTPRDP